MLINDLKRIMVLSTFVRIYDLRGKMLYEGFLKFTTNENGIHDFSINTMFINYNGELIITLNK